MKKYVSLLGAVSATTDKATTAASAVVPSKSGAMTGPSVTSVAKEMIPWAVGAAGGGYYWKKHRVLGALAGGSVAENAYDLVRGNRTAVQAATSVAATAAGVYGSMKYRKHPVLGFLGGEVLASVALSLVPGSMQKTAYEDWKAKHGR
jgi:hypothetical protein